MSTNRNDRISENFNPPAKKIVAYTAENSQLLIDYRAALLRAYELGNEVKELYGVIPPKVISYDSNYGVGTVHIGLTVN